MPVEYKNIFGKLQAHESAWEAFMGSESNLSAEIKDTNSALVLAADRLLRIYEDIHNVPKNERYRTPLPTDKTLTCREGWKQCALSLADELGESVPALFTEAREHLFALRDHATELAECFAFATTASASMIAGNLDEDAVSCGMRMKENLAQTDPEIFHTVMGHLE